MVAAIRKFRGPGDYYLQDQAEDYLNGTQRKGIWYDPHGVAGVEHGEPIDNDAFRSAMRGYHPATGVELTRNTGKEDRVSGIDLTFNDPKSGTLLRALADDDTRRRYDEIHGAALSKALDHVHEFAIRVRRGAERRDERAYAFGGIFPHTEARPTRAAVPPDPHFHTHVVFANAGKSRDDGQWAALADRELYRIRMAAGRIYNRELARGLRDEMGLSIRYREHGLFEVRGISDDVIDNFSKRRLQILDRVDALGLDGTDGLNAARAAGITRATRQAKAPSLDVDRFAWWSREARRLEMEQGETLLSTVRERGREELVQDYRQAVERSLRVERGSEDMKEAIRERAILAQEIRREGLDVRLPTQRERDVLSMDAEVSEAARLMQQVGNALSGGRDDDDAAAALKLKRKRQLVLGMRL